MKIGPENYERMRSWLAHLGPEVFPHARPEDDPIKVLDGFAAKSPAIARKSLAIGIADIVDLTGDWSSERVSALDSRLASIGLPTLSEIRTAFSKDVRRIVRRGQIRDEIEYYAIRNAADFPGDDQKRLWDLLEAYENSA